MIEYISKYVTKHEEKTLTYDQLMKKVLRGANARNPLLSSVRNLMNQLVGKRDWSAEEVCHLLLDLQLQQGSRSVIAINVGLEDQHHRPYHFTGNEEDGSVEELWRDSSWQEKYVGRPPWLDISLNSSSEWDRSCVSFLRDLVDTVMLSKFCRVL